MVSIKRNIEEYCACWYLVNLLMSAFQIPLQNLMPNFCKSVSSYKVFCTVWFSNWPCKSFFFLLTSNWRVHHTVCVFLSIKVQIRRRKIQLVNVGEERRRREIEWSSVIVDHRDSVCARLFGFPSSYSLINTSHLRWILHRINHQSFKKEQNRKFLLQPLHSFIWKGIRSLS